jgi:hypothetical protein
MASTYSSTQDPLKFQNPSHRAIAPARDGYLATPDPVNPLPLYGKPRVINTNAAVATIVVVPVAAQDDANTITLTYPPGAVVTEQLVVRQLVSAAAGVIVHVFV